MLLRKKILERIPTGEISIAFRRWKRPTVKPGGHLRTSIGELLIVAVDRCELDEITDADVVATGFSDRAALLAYMKRFEEGELYRVEFEYRGEDPRAARAARGELSDSEYAELRRALARLDRASRSGPWTERYLRLIAERPAVLAAELAESIGMERDPFKINVRKLKEKGLTLSRRYERGYRLSPCGEAYVARLDAERGKVPRRR